MVCRATKDPSQMCRDISCQIKNDTPQSYVDEDGMKSVRFRLRDNSHDPSVSVTNEMSSATCHTENDMGKIVRNKDSKTMSEGELTRIKRNKRISRRKDVCKSMPIILENDTTAETLEERIKAIVLDSSATRSKDDESLLQQPPANLDEVIQERISRGSNITDTEKIYHKLCRKTKSLIFKCGKVGGEVDKKEKDKTDDLALRRRSQTFLVECEKENSQDVSHSIQTPQSVRNVELIPKSAKLSTKTTKEFLPSKSTHQLKSADTNSQPSRSAKLIKNHDLSQKDSRHKSKPKKDEECKTVVRGEELVLRQCLIGSSTVFGLVQIKTVTSTHNSNGYPEGHGLVTIRMIPDEQGRFGFNVKCCLLQGGADQGMPIIVSRVAPNTPADLAIPRLNEGDQVLYINGRDVSQHTHEQVVMFIRASRETHSGELVLIVRPNVYVGEEQADHDPDLVYLPDSHQITGSLTGANALENSLMLLQESLESAAALAQFEQLYRKKPGMTMNAARQDANIAKNRYRDISPYDQTRVILKGQTDYINANYVNMEIPGSGIVNRYIAAQGPLPATCTDFWQMVCEQHTSLLVMLTMKNERGRVKCHQYWPEMYETLNYGALQITCVKEDVSTSFAFREFNLTNIETREERHISHMQYIAWPDHGVPDDPADFLDFVIKVRERRQGMVEPTVVHCSAGIGRTGVLITMETAMCLIEANQPVYPLSIVRQMRDQRAMLIQTASQYKFVCEAVLKVFNDGIVKPMEDYQR